METERRYKEAETSFIGKQLGDYQVLSFIAQGGQASVYRARDSKLGREAAIKVFLRTVFRPADHRQAGKRGIPGFVSQSPEYRHNLRHSPRAFDFFYSHGLIDGKTLHDVLSRGRMQIPVVLQTSAQIAAGLSKAHGLGLFTGT